MACTVCLTTACRTAEGEHSSSILGVGKDITLDHLIRLGKKADMKVPDINEVIEKARAATSNWKSFASRYGVSEQSTNMIAAALAKVRL